MSKYGLQPLEKHHDWKMVGAGAALIVVALVFLAWPQGSLVALTVLAGIVFLVSGIVGLAAAGDLRGISLASPWFTTYGVLDLIVGALLVIFPAAFSVILPWLVGIMFIVFGIFEISSFSTMKRLDGSFGALGLVSGVVGILCGIMLFVAPATIIVLMGIYFLVRGVAMIVRGYNEDRLFV